MKKIIVGTVALFLVACSSTKSEEKVDTAQEVVEQTAKTVETPNMAAKIDITHFYAGPNLMKTIGKHADELNLTDAQKAEFEAWRLKAHPEIGQRAMAIKALEKEIYQMSLDKKPLGEILAKTGEAIVLRDEIAKLKTDCVLKIKNTLDADQYAKVIEFYKAENKFNERAEMPTRMAHVDPTPNYLKILKEQADTLKLNDEQKAKFEAYLNENRPKVFALANKLVELEKVVYEKALAGENLEAIQPTLDEISKLRSEIVQGKITCRDFVVSSLDDAQWVALVALMPKK